MRVFYYINLNLCSLEDFLTQKNFFEFWPTLKITCQWIKFPQYIIINKWLSKHSWCEFIKISKFPTRTLDEFWVFQAWLVFLITTILLYFAAGAISATSEQVSKSEKITHLKIVMLKKIEFSCEFNICVHISITYCGRLHSQADIQNHSQHPTYKTKEKWFKKCVIGWSNDKWNNLYYLLIKLLFLYKILNLYSM